jgi:hypothetical protein
MAHAHIPRVHLSPFLETAAAGWFTAAELAFAAHGLNAPQLRYSAVLQALPGHLQTDLGDLPQRHLQNALAIADDALREASWTAAYAELRQTLVERCSISSRAALRQLISVEKRGDARPSVFLRRLQSLVAGRGLQCDDFIREVFIDNLPATVRPVIVALPVATPLDQLAATADTILESLPASQAVVNAVHDGHAASNTTAITRSQATDETSHVARLEKQLAALTQQMTALAAQLAAKPSAERPRSRSRGAWQPLERTDTRCYYHANFGDRARKCGETASGRRCDLADTPPAAEPERGRSRSRTRALPALPPPTATNLVDLGSLSTLLGALGLHAVPRTTAPEN